MVVLVVLFVASFFLWVPSRPKNAVPLTIRKSIVFPIYYPSQLPSGYSLDTKSFQLAQPGVVLFAVTYGSGKNIVFSEEQQPADNNMNKFISNYIPINTSLHTALGQARVGAYGNAPTIRTVVSLPITKGPWVIISAPSDVNNNNLTKIIQALKK